jgi:hypothetical protein
MKNIPLLIACFAAFSLAAALIYEKSKPEKIREVPKEVIREIPKEVVREVEIIKEVPKEVIREVEVIKEIERSLTDLENFYIAIGKGFFLAKLSTETEDILRDVGPVAIQVQGSQEALKILPEQKMRDAFELALRGNGIEISPNSRFTAFCLLDLLWNDGKSQAVFVLQTGVSTNASFLASAAEVRAVNTEIVRNTSFGLLGSSIAEKELPDEVENQSKKLALKLLRARDKK